MKTKLIGKCCLGFRNKSCLILHPLRNFPFPFPLPPSPRVCPTWCLTIRPWKVEWYSQNQQENATKLAVFAAEGARASAFEQGYETEPWEEERLLGHQQPGVKATGRQIKAKKTWNSGNGSVERGSQARAGIWSHLRGCWLSTQ